MSELDRVTKKDIAIMVAPMTIAAAVGAGVIAVQFARREKRIIQAEERRTSETTIDSNNEVAKVSDKKCLGRTLSWLLIGASAAVICILTFSSVCIIFLPNDKGITWFSNGVSIYALVVPLLLIIPALFLKKNTPKWYAFFYLVPVTQFAFLFAKLYSKTAFDTAAGIAATLAGFSAIFIQIIVDEVIRLWSMKTQLKGCSDG